MFVHLGYFRYFCKKKWMSFLFLIPNPQKIDALYFSSC